MRALFLSLALLAATAAPALASTVELKDGSSVEADRLHYTYTHLVVITPGNDMRLIPNESIKAVDGVSFTRAYWTDRPGQFEDGDPTAPATNKGPTDIAKLMPLRAGTFRRYDLEQIRTTWVRRGQQMERRETVEAGGSVRESIAGPMPGYAGITLAETISERVPGQPMHEISLRHAIEGREAGYFLTAQEMTDVNLAPPTQADRISQPPMLWPQTLQVGQKWVVGPFSRMGVGQVSAMEVVGVESISVPSGTYPEAYKVIGKGNLFGGTQHLKAGRLVTDHGTIETTTWIVAGVGPVRELSKVHLHQDFFPAGSTGGEIPIVVEEEATRALAEFQLGQ